MTELALDQDRIDRLIDALEPIVDPETTLDDATEAELLQLRSGVQQIRDTLFVQSMSLGIAESLGEFSTDGDEPINSAQWVDDDGTVAATLTFSEIQKLNQARLRYGIEQAEEALRKINNKLGIEAEE